MMRSTLVRSLVLLGILALIAPHARAADDIDAKALARADRFLKTAKRGQFIVSICHFGQKYLSHRYDNVTGVLGVKGRPGHFALAYDFRASDGLETKLLFLCNAKGSVYEVQVRRSNGIVQEPFLVAKASMKLVGELAYEVLKDRLTEADKRVLRKLIDDADARALLAFCLQVQQLTE